MANGNKRRAPSSLEDQPPARRPRVDTRQGNNSNQAVVPGTTSATGHGAATGQGNTQNQAVLPAAPPAPARRALNGPLPVDRRAAYPPSPAQTSVPRTEAEREERITALRNQLRYPHAIARLILVGFLSGAGWDVNRAAAVFWEGHNRYNHLNLPLLGAPNQANNSAALRPGIHHAQRAGGQVRRGDNVEQGRLRLLVDVQMGLRNSIFNNRPRLRTTNANMTLLLHEQLWDNDEITKVVNDLNGDYRRLSERVDRLRHPTEHQPSRDERLALLISITSTNSWYSARALLQNHNWDLARAIDDWIRQGGIRVVDPPPNTQEEIKRKGKRSWNANKPREIINGSFDDDDFEEEPLGPPDQNIEGGDSGPIKGRPSGHKGANAKPGQDDDGNTTHSSHRPGFVIDDDRRQNTRVRAPDASRLRIEYIRNGRYGVEHFDGANPDDDQWRVRSKFSWDDGDTRPEFDWNNRAHISFLSKWRSDRLLKVTGEKKRLEVRTPFNKYERDWLREQEAIRTEERFYELAQQDRFQSRITNPQAWNAAMTKAPFDGRPFPMPAAELDALTARFNQQFGNRTMYTKVLWKDNKYVYIPKDMSEVGEVPRPHRTSLVIGQERRRIRAYAKHFHLTYDGNVPGGGSPDSESDSDCYDERNA
ncbi:hypothetical protein LTR10_017716 [Elasticomyces elasticus]|uniref:Uncharacterized protein n=1 Tax=Exophiala sideris TaxID=1016849 RepID=A0ABR0JC55_9EURO|nr:hypothetical protein LTR10_017716 [Elasticomyces elasticus]KAK5031035.1 hypothetical protein LTS07_004770 [Exophiala sideris]KAK5038757.1 hypothetical protein LTR13_003788 [Exophiala sideris]KAK5060640.1 hypothetical protein LTR69_005239 [Exophiala sideris]KAK5183553.1 hypothetical protein LTR44_003835 [Eurotiomycetes sp. CCFEE 6388]